MNKKIVSNILLRNGIWDYAYGFNDAGIYLAINIRDVDKPYSICSLLPIDDASDIEFAEAMVHEYKKIKGDE